MTWLLSNNRLEKVPFVSVLHTSSNRLLLSNQDKGYTPSVAHSLPLPLGPALLNLWIVSNPGIRCHCFTGASLSYHRNQAFTTMDRDHEPIQIVHGITKDDGGIRTAIEPIGHKFCSLYCTGNSLSISNNQAFTTRDRDHDSDGGKNCALKYKGAWWYNACHDANLNGLYLRGTHTSTADGVNWLTWRGHHYSLKQVEMKIRRLP